MTSDKSIVKLKKSLETIHKIVLNGNVTDMGFQIWDNFKSLSFFSTTVPHDHGDILGDILAIELIFLWSHKN